MRPRNSNGRKPSRISATDSDSSSEESLILHKPPVFGNAISHVPCKATPASLLSPVSEDYISEEENICSPPFTESSSDDDLFRPCSHRKAFSLDKSFTRENAFSLFDDPNAHFPLPVTPKSTPKFVLLPLNTPDSAIKERYVTNEKKIALKKAALEGRRDFIRTLEKVGIDPQAHFSSLGIKLADLFNIDCRTPEGDSLPDISDASSNFDTSLDDELPEDVRATLLSGIVCYVQCRTGKEDRSEGVKDRLEKLGARVEKNFTKKVTHVVFKEGRRSTYIRAKKRNIPIVGVLWIKACEKARGIADPSMHYPKNMEKFDRILPFQMLPKRRFDILNPNSKLRKRLSELCQDSPQLNNE